jgi:hypothetical protein
MHRYKGYFLETTVFRVRFDVTPIRHVAAVAAIELCRNAIVAMRAAKSIVLFRFHRFLVFNLDLKPSLGFYQAVSACAFPCQS